jgi:hypothetical protein
MQPYCKSTCLQPLTVFKLMPNHQLMMKSFWGKVSTVGRLDIEGGWWRCPDLTVGGGAAGAELRRRWRRSRGGVK